MPKKFYIKERHNPQLDKPYYMKYGQLTKKAAKDKERSLYGYNHMLAYDTEEQYNEAITKLEEEGFSIS